MRVLVRGRNLPILGSEIVMPDRTSTVLTDELKVVKDRWL